MSRNDLLKELKRKYSFEKALSFIQIAEHDRFFENDDVKIIMVKNLKSNIYSLQWKN